MKEMMKEQRSNMRLKVEFQFQMACRKKDVAKAHSNTSGGALYQIIKVS